MHPAISVRKLSKRFRVNQMTSRVPYRTLRDSLARIATAPLRRIRGELNSRDKDFWALKEVQFDVASGEVLGIIGRNGAGKSTLLKILSRVIMPTIGEIQIRGRVGSLLEVGTGFHPELTGRENIFMNGSILGMSRAEIRRSFDAIVAFADVERFLDVPVKRYSSGMHVRLAFAVAAYLQPEVLIVDEVLAVGDAAFQQKCLGRMREVSQSGRTVLFVSHNMVAVENLCDRAIILADGQVSFDGSPTDAIHRYFLTFESVDDGQSFQQLRRKPTLRPVIHWLDYQNDSGQVIRTLPAGQAITFRISYEHDNELIDPYFGVTIEALDGKKICWLQTRFQVGQIKCLPARGVVECSVSSLPLAPGTYFITVGCGCGGTQLDLVERARRLEVIGSDFFGTGRLPNHSESSILLHANWQANGIAIMPKVSEENMLQSGME